MTTPHPVNACSIFPDIVIHGHKKLSISINYDSTIPINIYTATLRNKPGKILHNIEVSPSLAKQLIKELQKQLEWYNNPLYKWAKNKTSLNKQNTFRRI